MKISQICAVAVLLAVSSMMAFADGIQDPKIIIHGVNGGNGPESCGPSGCQGVGQSISLSPFRSPEKGFLYFTNESGKNWTSLTLVETACRQLILAARRVCS